MAPFVCTGKPFLDVLSGVHIRTHHRPQGVPSVVVLTIAAIPPLVCVSGLDDLFVDVLFPDFYLLGFER